MILNSPTDVHRLQPDEGSPVAYNLRIPSILDRVKFRHAVRTEGAKQWSQIQMLGVLEDGLKQIMTEPEDHAVRDEHLGVIAEYRARVMAAVDEYRDIPAFGDDDQEAQVKFMNDLVERMRPPPVLLEIERVVADHYIPYARMVADREVYQQLAGLIAARQFLVGWEGIDAPFKRTRLGVPDEVLGAIPSRHLIVIGTQIQELLEPSMERLRPLASRSGSEPDQPASNGTETPPERIPSKKTRGTAPSSESKDSESIH